MDFIRLSENGVKNYTLVPGNNILQKLDLIKNHDKEYFSSIYCYNDEHYKKWLETKSVAGFDGLKTNLLVFDLDNKEDPSISRQDAIELSSRLINHGIPEDDIQVYFSGNKGFHIVVSTDQEMNVDEFRLITRGVANDLATFDKSVSDQNRLLRVVLTKHPKTGLYKIPLTVSLLKEHNMDEIREYAKNHYELYDELIKKWSSKKTALPNQLASYKIVKPKVVSKMVQNELDLSRKPKWLADAKYALQEGYFEAGERNTACMILASTYKAQGFSAEHVAEILKVTLRKRADRLGIDPEVDEDELQHGVINIVFGPNWRGGSYSYESTHLLQDVTKRLGLRVPAVEEKPITSMGEVSDFYSTFAKNIDSNTVKLGIPTLDANLRITSSMLIGVVAAPSAGKSSLAFDILRSTSNAGVKSMFFSMDMGKPLVYQRLAQKETGMHSNQIIDAYKNGTGSEKRITLAIRENYKNVGVCFNSGLTVENIREMIINDRDETGTLAKVIVIDYLECIQSDFTDPSVSAGQVCQKLKDIANEFDCAVIVLLQPQKIAGDPRDEISSYTKIKGSSVIQQACSVIISLHRPGFDPRHPEDDRYISFSVLKNRMGSLGTYDFEWDGVRGSITELSEEGREHLKSIRYARDNEKKESSGGFNI